MEEVRLPWNWSTGTCSWQRYRERKKKVLKSTMKAGKMSDMQMALTERMERPRVRFQNNVVSWYLKWKKKSSLGRIKKARVHSGPSRYSMKGHSRIGDKDPLQSLQKGQVKQVPYWSGWRG